MFKISDYTHVMVDLETLGTHPGCAILSIGATTFMDQGMGPEYYEKIDPSAGINDPILTRSEETMKWWSEQDKSVRDEAFSGTKSTEEVLREFSAYLAQFDKPILLYGKGADFDNIVLAAAYDAYDMVVPWNFRNNMCIRTLMRIMPENLKPEVDLTNTQKHNALEDAKYQAQWAENIFAVLLEAGLVRM